MEEVINCNERLLYCLNKVNILISKVDKFNTTLRIANKNADLLEISGISINSIDISELENLKEHFCTLIENSYTEENEIKKEENELEEKVKIIENELEKEIKFIEESQNQKIYEKAMKLIYVCRWRAKEREILYLDYKESFISKIIGEAKFKQLSIEKKKLESKIIKKEYYKIIKEYKGESIREIVIKLYATPDRDNELFDFRDKLVKTFMIDEATINTNIDIEWIAPNLIPYGFFEKIKYYKKINKILEQEIIELRNSLEDDVKIEENRFSFEKKIIDLAKINNGIRALINGIKTV